MAVFIIIIIIVISWMCSNRYITDWFKTLICIKTHTPGLWDLKKSIIWRAVVLNEARYVSLFTQQRFRSITRIGIFRCVHAQGVLVIKLFRILPSCNGFLQFWKLGALGLKRIRFSYFSSTFHGVNPWAGQSCGKIHIWVNRLASVHTYTRGSWHSNRLVIILAFFLYLMTV